MTNSLTQELENKINRIISFIIDYEELDNKEFYTEDDEEQKREIMEDVAGAYDDMIYFYFKMGIYELKLEENTMQSLDRIVDFMN